jgi:hypothetical protein
VRIVFVRTGSIAATFVHGPGQEHRLECVMRPVSGGEPVFALLFPSISETGTTYSWSALLPGTWRLAATLLGETEPCLTVDGIDIRPGENVDPRLESIVLPDVATLTVELRDASGALIEDFREGQLYLRARSGEWTGRLFTAARTSVLVRPGPTDLVVVVPGYRPIRRNGAAGTVTAELAPLPAVDVRLVCEGGSAGKPRLRVRAEPLDPGPERYRLDVYGETAVDGPSPWLGSAWIGNGRTGRITVEGAGAYRLRVHGGGHPAPELSGFKPEAFTVPETGALPTIELRVPAEAWTR